jgi:hypothetical protein
MRCKAAGFRLLKILRAAQVAVRQNEGWILHALHCERCQERDTALGLLFLAGLTEAEFVDQVWADLVMGGDDAAATAE